MTHPKKSRASQKNGHQWSKVAGVAKRQWAREPGPTLCHLCYAEIDMSAPSKADRSLSIDHVVPVAVDPSLEYRLSNLRPSCWICNSVRGDRPVDEIHADIPAFRREVDRAIARRKIAAEARADKALTTGTAFADGFPETPPSSRNWFAGGPPVETDEQRRQRYEHWLALPPEWR